jgi:hypothetical protein
MSAVEHLAEGVTLYLGDCREILPTLGKVDAVVTDPPYGTTQNTWDMTMPMDEFWRALCSAAGDSAPIVLTAAQPFTSFLIVSNREDFRYCWVWDRVNKYTNFLNAKRQPMRRHEDIVVFARGAGSTFNPQMTPVASYKSRRSKPADTESYGKVLGCDYGKTVNEHGPCSVLEIPAHFTVGIEHPTQKPVALNEYLALTYSNVGDTILDPFMGSGTTGVAAVRLGRRFIGVEIEPKYFDLSCRRIADELARPRLNLEPRIKEKQEALAL